MLYPRKKIFPFLNPSLKTKQNKKHVHLSLKGFPGGSAGKGSTCNAEDPGTATYSSILASMECIVPGFSISQT